MADIVAANLYQHYLSLKKSASSAVLPQIPACRQFPSYVELSAHPVEAIHSVLVQTGVSQANQNGDHAVSSPLPQKDFPESSGYIKPSYVFKDVHEALQNVLQIEGYLSPWK